MKTRGINTFQDDKRLELGDSISEELLKAIQDSAISVIIFSRNYASSGWCLDEVVEIMRCKDVYGQLVIPVFYDVDPSVVRYQRESFADAFMKHESRYTTDDVKGMQKVKSWRAALNAAADLSGCDIRKGIESENVQKIVDRICSKLRTSASLSYWQDVVGVKTHLEKVKSLLEIEVNDVRIMGIWGMGGVGKTTVARAIFDTLSDQFEAACFLADVKENEKRNQLHSLQNVLLSELLRKTDDYVNNKHDGQRMISSRLCSKKVLIVLDDVDSRDHLEYLACDVGWFGEGSRVIVTTRDSHLIDKNNAIYEMTTLADQDALQLFNQHAFKKEVPDKSFRELSLEVVKHAKGLPLALKVWGSLLHKRGLKEWRSALDRIKENSGSEIIERLKISYDALDPEEQEIFLDIACFFRGYKKEKVIQKLESCGFRAHIGLNVLTERSLVFISGEGRIEMHDLIQDMGKYVVNKHKDPGERSRLWLEDDLEEVLVNKTGTNAMEAIWIRYSFNKLSFYKEAMENMKRLRILRLWVEPRQRPRRRSAMVDQVVIEYLPNNLRWVVWMYYPCESLPTNFEAKMLVHLQLTYSSLRVFQTGTKHFPSLRMLNLSHSSRLMQAPDFTGMPNLEYLYLNDCMSLEGVHYSLGNCNKLISLNLSHCVRLKRFSSVNLECLEYLNLRQCFELESFPEIIGRMKLESEIGMAHSWIRKLNLYGLKCLVALPSIICRSKNLVELDVSWCCKLERLPEELGDLENLEKLDASHTLISRPPSSIVRLNKLKFLCFEKGEMYDLKDREYFVFPPVAEGLRSLEVMNFSYCNLIDGGLPEDIGCLSFLNKLFLKGSKFEHLPGSIAELGALQFLDLSGCERLTHLPELPPKLERLCVDFDIALKSIPILATKNGLLLITCKSLRERNDASIKIPSWFLHRGRDESVSINLPENWFECANFLGVAVYLSGLSLTTTIQLIPLCNDGMILEVTRYNDLEYGTGYCHFFMVPVAGLQSTSVANGKSPNDYGFIRVSFIPRAGFGYRLLYKDELEPEALLQMRGNNDNEEEEEEEEPTEHCIGIRRSMHDNDEASSSSSKKQRSHCDIHGFENTKQQVEEQVSSGTLQLFPTTPGI